MKTDAYFEDIKKVITNEISNARSSILVAVAWFTDNDLFSLLCKKAKDGINVEIIIANHEININSKINYESIKLFGGKIYIDGNEFNNSLMHNKFCIIDLKRTITGSYNWSYQAGHNKENITITEDSVLAEKFARYFYYIKRGKKDSFYNPNEKEIINLSYYLNRVLNFIEKGEFEKINTELFIIKNLEYIDENILNIIILCDNKLWNRVIDAIQEYFHANNQLVLFDDFEIKTLKFYKESLESKFDKLILTKNEIEKKTHQFSIKYNQILGSYLLQLIELKNKYNLSYKEEYERTKETINNATNSFIKNINEVEQDKLKKLYKKAAIICHPDKVKESQKDEAEKFFKQLNNAYRNNDLNEVEKIYKNLKENNFFINEKQKNHKEILKMDINKLLYKITQIEFEIKKLEISPIYQIILNVHDWDLFYKLEEKKIIDEINEIQYKFSKININKKKRKKYGNY